MNLRGVIPVLTTPFHADESIDESSLRRQIDFCIASGVELIKSHPSICHVFSHARGQDGSRANRVDANVVRREIQRRISRHLQYGPLGGAVGHKKFGCANKDRKQRPRAATFFIAPHAWLSADDQKDAIPPGVGRPFNTKIAAPLIRMSIRPYTFTT